ncbi:MAG: hypothetical protein LBI49_12445, partial [Nocardiopsaceae bacterium]|nr:hypothetical protein [Nocardiopsaceae bacterium]
MEESPAEPVPGGDAGLIEALRDGEAAAFRRLRIRHEGAAQILASKLPGEPPVSSVVGQAFVRVRDAIRGGGGPAEAFRPYLFTTLRRVAAERMHGAGPRAGQEAPWPEDAPVLPEWKPFLDREVAFLARTPMVRAFLSLPECDLAVLWYADIELAKAAQAAVPLGLTRSAVRALRKQASDRLRQAYLRHHLAGTRSGCRQLADRLSAHASGALRTNKAGDVVGHLRECRDCRDAHAELSGLGASLRGLVAPVFLGAAATAYLQVPSGRLAFPEQSEQAQRSRPPLPLAAPVRVAALGAGGVAVTAGATVAVWVAVAATSSSPSHFRGHEVVAAPPAGSSSASPPASAPARHKPAPARQAPAPPPAGGSGAVAAGPARTPGADLADGLLPGHGRGAREARFELPGSPGSAVPGRGVALPPGQFQAIAAAAQAAQAQGRVP